MYKVLLVDDESIDLDWIKTSINWTSLNLEVVGVFNSSIKALEYMKNNKVDILISDIQMPIINGLKLVRCASEYNQNFKVLFISGHEEFDYAREALELNAYGYILKPVEISKLIDLLKGIVVKITEQEKLFSKKIEFDKQFERVKNEVIYKWIRGKADDLDFTLLNQLNIDMNNKVANVCVMTIDDIEWKLENDVISKSQDALMVVANTIYSYEKQMNFKYYYINSRDQIIIINNDISFEIIYTNFKKLIEIIKEKTGFTVTVGMGKVVRKIVNLRNSFENAEVLLNYKMHLGKNRIIHEKDIIISSHEIENIDEYIYNLTKAVSTNRLTDVTINLRRLLNAKNSDESQSSFYNYVLHILYRFDEIARREYDINAQSLMGWDIKFYYKVYNFETVDDIYKWLRDNLFELAQRANENKNDSEKLMIIQIKNYINENINKKLVLKDVAEHFQFSPNYFGFIFKKETGVNFSDYLIEQRLTKACEYLKNSNLKIYEVAEKMGYKNLVFFNRQFKQKFYISPSEYRKKNKVKL